jgi:protein phosphatase
VDVEGPHALRAGDVFVLCSDGLSGQVTDREIGAVTTVLPPQEASRFLIHLANLRGGPDNITVQIVRITTTPKPQSSVMHGPLPRMSPFRWLPWPIACVISGTLAAGGGISMHATDIPGGKYVFLLGSFTLIAGLGGLLLHVRREKQEAGLASREKPSPPRVHRRAGCAIDEAMVEKLSRSVENLRQYADEKGWEPDWATFQRHYSAAEQALGHRDLPGAFREYCRALLPLADFVDQQRNKGEDFRPVWD